MANLVDDSGSVNSNLVTGSGTNAATFTMPGNVALQVESVVALVNNAAGAATGATLEVRDQSGVVISTKRQARTIPAGDTGSMSWSLRNSGDDELTGIFYDIANSGEWLNVKTTSTSGGDGMVFEAVLGDIRFFADDSATGAFRVDAPFIRFDTDGVSFRLLDSGETFFVAADAASWEFGGFAMDTTYYVINATTTGNITTGGNYEENIGGNSSNSTNGSYSVDAANIGLHAAAGDIALGLEVGGAVTVFDHLGNAIFRVNEDGSLQGKTGKALTFNL